MSRPTKNLTQDQRKAAIATVKQKAHNYLNANFGDYDNTASPYESCYTVKGMTNDRSTRRLLAENLLGTIKLNGNDLESGNANLKALYQRAINEASVMHRPGFLGLSGARCSIPDPKSRVCRMIVALCKACDPNFSTYEKSCRVQRQEVTTENTHMNGLRAQ